MLSQRKHKIKNPASILVFKTSVQTKEHINQLRMLLNKEVGKHNWNFALDDDDKIFRINAVKVNVSKTIQLFKCAGFSCEELKD